MRDLLHFGLQLLKKFETNLIISKLIENWFAPSKKFLKFYGNKATRLCAIAHKVPTPLIHNFGMIVYQMRNMRKNSEIQVRLKKLVYERKHSLESN